MVYLVVNSQCEERTSVKRAQHAAKQKYTHGKMTKTTKTKTTLAYTYNDAYFVKTHQMKKHIHNSKTQKQHKINEPQSVFPTGLFTCGGNGRWHSVQCHVL